MTIPVVNISTNKTLDGTYANQRVNVTGASVVTVPNSSTYNFTNSDEIFIIRNTASAVRFVAASGVTILSKGGSLTISVQYGCAHLMKLSENVWILSGDI